MRRATAVSTAAVVCLILGACSDLTDLVSGKEELKPNGVAEMDPQTAIATADKAMTELLDATYVGTDSLDTGRGKPFRGDASMTLARGNRCELRGNSLQKGSFVLRYVEGKAFFQSDRIYSREVLGLKPAQAEEVSTKWVAMPQAKAEGRCDTGRVAPDPKHRASFQAGETDTIGGVPVRAFSGRDGDGPLTVWIALEGDPYVLKMAGEKKAGPYEYALAAKDQLRGIAAPTEAEIFRSGG